MSPGGRAPLRALYVDLDGTLFGAGASLFLDGDGSFTMLGARVVEACHRAGVELVPYSGRQRRTLFEDARVLGSRAFLFEAGACAVIDGEDHWLTGHWQPAADGTTVRDQVEAAGAPQLLLERWAGALEYHAPWHLGRDVSHLMRGDIDTLEAEQQLRDAGIEHLRVLDNGIIADPSPTLPMREQHSYHLVPDTVSKASAVAFHMRARGYAPEEVIAAGDSREDLTAAAVVGTFYLVANGLADDPSIAEALGRHDNAVVTEAGFGPGVHEALVGELAARR